ncbi:unnamed protein product, partial [Protopolystoma xenopodis]
MSKTDTRAEAALRLATVAAVGQAPHLSVAGGSMANSLRSQSRHASTDASASYWGSAAVAAVAAAASLGQKQHQHQQELAQQFHPVASHLDSTRQAFINSYSQQSISVTGPLGVEERCQERHPREHAYMRMHPHNHSSQQLINEKPSHILARRDSSEDVVCTQR